MTHFIGHLLGQSTTMLTREGTKSSGLLSVLNARRGGIKARIYHDADMNADMAEVSLHPEDGPETLLYHGPLSMFEPMPKRPKGRPKRLKL